MPTCRPLSQAEIGRALESKTLSTETPLGQRNHMLFQLMLCTGFRISEVLGLTVADVYNAPKRKMLDRIVLKSRARKGRGVEMEIALPDECQAELLEYLTTHELKGKPSAKLFDITPRRSEQILAALKAEMEWEGTVSNHSLRKTLGKQVYEQTGHDLEKTRMALGHKQITSTQCYITADKDEVRDFMKKLKLGYQAKPAASDAPVAAPSRHH